MSQTTVSLLIVFVMFGLAVYLLVFPPPGFADSMAYQVTLPFVLIVCAFNVLENIRTRAHVTQLIGAIRGAMGKAGAPPTPEAKAEAIEILIQSLHSEKPAVRHTAAGQLQKLTGQDLGEDPAAWSDWWEANKGGFGK